ncbi:MAG: hypothetical protein ACHQIO_20425, partial [Nevskiales bacterium]
GTPGSGALMWINAMIRLTGKGTVMEDNVPILSIPVRIELAGRPHIHGRIRCHGSKPPPRRFPCLREQHPIER